MARQLFDATLLSIINPDSSIEVGAKLYWYEAGSATPVSTYTTSDGAVANSNPVVAGSDGRFPPIWLDAGDYKFVLTTAEGSPTSPLASVDDFTIYDTPPAFALSLFNFLSGAAPLAIANGGTGATSAVNALTNLGALGLSGGTMRGNITRQGKGVHLFHAAAGMTSGEIFLTASGASDPTSLPGQIWMKY